jgi:hypothetical protein
MGGSCNMHGKGKKHTKFWSENLVGKHYSEDLGVAGRIILGRILQK